MKYITEKTLIKYIAYLLETNSISLTSAVQRKAAVNQIFSVLEKEKNGKLSSTVDVNKLIKKFRNTSLGLSRLVISKYASSFKTTIRNYLKFRSEIYPNIPKGNTPKKLRKKDFSNFDVPIRNDVIGCLKIPKKISKTEAMDILDFIQRCVNQLIVEDKLD
jgi:hypothetical protein